MPGYRKSKLSSYIGCYRSQLEFLPIKPEMDKFIKTVSDVI